MQLEKSYQNKMVSSQNTYGLNRPIHANGEPSSYLRILYFIKENPGTTKIDVLNNVCGYSISDDERYEYRGTKSTTFAALKQAGFISYGLTGKGTVQITSEGRQYIIDVLSKLATV